MRSSGAWVIPFGTILVALIHVPVVTGAETARAVAELFTSQGCSSCPPADAVAGRLRTNPAVIVLSFHVNYWDGPQWRDPYFSQASTDREHAYAMVLGEPSVFTPQLVVNGTQSLVGSQEVAIQRAITASNHAALPVKVELSKHPDGGLAFTLNGPAIDTEMWEADYVQRTVTQIRGGENGGRTLETYNDVIRIRRLGTFTTGTLLLPALKAPANGVAVVVQAPGLGKVLGAGAY